MSGRLFGTDGIRGTANLEPMTAETALRVGMAAGRLFTRGEHHQRVVIGKDTRLSCYMIEYALTAGFASVGMEVLLLGPMPTPAVGMLTRSLRADLGVMISASHNAFTDNGIKLFGPDGYKLSDEVEAKIEALVKNGLDDGLASPAKIGRAKRIDDAQARYIEFAKATFPKHLSLEGLRAKVRETRADLGVALDGDADRALLVDEHGQMIDGDQVMALVAKSWAENGRLKGQGVVSTVMANLGLERFLGGLGLKLVRTVVGDRYVVEHMRRHGFNVGGEPSGHIVLSDYSTTGDGLIAALQVLAMLAETGKRASEVCHLFDAVPQIMTNVRYRNGVSPDDASVKAAIEKAKEKLGKKARLVIRKSGTEPVIRVMAEGDDTRLLQTVVGDIVAALEQASR